MAQGSLASSALGVMPILHGQRRQGEPPLLSSSRVGSRRVSHGYSGWLWGGELGVCAGFSRTACVDGSDEKYHGYLLSIGDSRLAEKGCLQVHALETHVLS